MLLWHLLFRGEEQDNQDFASFFFFFFSSLNDSMNRLASKRSMYRHVNNERENYVVSLYKC